MAHVKLSSQNANRRKSDRLLASTSRTHSNVRFDQKVVLDLSSDDVSILQIYIGVSDISYNNLLSFFIL